MAARTVNSCRYAPRTIKKAIKVVRLFLDEEQGLGTSEIARRLSLPKSTTFGILEDLTKEGWISKDPVAKKYSVGAGLVELAKSIFSQASDVMPLALSNESAAPRMAVLYQ